MKNEMVTIELVGGPGDGRSVLVLRHLALMALATDGVVFLPEELGEWRNGEFVANASAASGGGICGYRMDRACDHGSETWRGFWRA